MSNQFPIPPDDPIILSILQRRLIRADQPIIFFKYGRRRGQVTGIRRATHFKVTMGQMFREEAALPNWWTMALADSETDRYVQSETLSLGEVTNRLKMRQEAGYIRLDLLELK
jgi:hypothetical protein